MFNGKKRRAVSAIVELLVLIWCLEMAYLMLSAWRLIISLKDLLLHALHCKRCAEVHYIFKK